MGAPLEIKFPPAIAFAALHRVAVEAREREQATGIRLRHPCHPHASSDVAYTIADRCLTISCGVCGGERFQVYEPEEGSDLPELAHGAGI